MASDDLRPIRRREDLPPLERAVSDALDELGVRCYGRISGWVYPVEFLEFLAEEGHTVIAAEELETARAALAEEREITAGYRRVNKEAIDALDRVRAIPREPFEPNPGEIERAYIRGWQSVIAAIDTALDSPEPR